jgi:divalent metal cation (Fe/Co/Zn/Cd) transporter
MSIGVFISSIVIFLVLFCTSVQRRLGITALRALESNRKTDLVIAISVVIGLLIVLLLLSRAN